MEVIPTCRYGHGDLIEVDRIQKNHYWGFIGAEITSVGQPTDNGEKVNVVNMSDHVFTMKLYRCPVCGYLEAFDYEDSDGLA
ncbi:hypothetical protein [Burkholderia multivorans]|uniref:hypothetical protein n=1 Tax=Burkholderia multivorans TaxID=87883 RepID=UPI0021BF4A39|nr:hypothetical protein [Burkholderia multivorans]